MAAFYLVKAPIAYASFQKCITVLNKFVFCPSVSEYGPKDTVTNWNAPVHNSFFSDALFSLPFSKDEILFTLIKHIHDIVHNHPQTLL
ncbi:hypothetical protein BSM4216_0305 [Bacillus smithii]|jgi:hypothetical protein|nr:hypothetical protein BSM4216_0305 [Bacillus smithii]